MGDVSRNQFGPFFIDVRERVLRRDGSAVPLTPKAFDLLAAFVDQPGRLIPKEELLQKVWPDTFVEEANLAYHVFALRKALGDTAEDGHYIETIPKHGYRFRGTVTPVTAGNGKPAAPDGLAESPSRFPTTPVSLEVERTRVPARFSPLMPRWRLVALIPASVAVVYVAAQSWRAPPAPEPVRALPLTSLSGVVRSPSLSPDGRYVAFTWTGAKRDNVDIYVQQIGAGSPLRLTTDAAHDYSPSWSPDGGTIAFLRRQPAGPGTEVRLIAPLGGSGRKLADIQPVMASYRPHSLAWCPDSRCVVVTDSAGPGKPDAVFAIVLDSGEKRQLTYPQGQVIDTDPAISPDARSLVFRRDSTPFSGAFYRVSLKERAVPQGEPVRLTKTLRAGRPAWTPDSRAVVFADRGALWRLDALGGGTPTRLPFVGQDGLSPVLSRTPDGRQRLVYVRSFADANVWRVDTSTAGAPAPAPPVPAIVSTRSDYIPSLSPDGGRLVFSSDRSGETEFWLADLDGSNAIQLTSMAILPGFPRWSPDGRLIAFHGDPDGRPDVLVVPADGGNPRIMTADLPNGGFPSFSRDGHWIYFTVVRNGEARIWKMPASGGDAVQVTDNAGALAIESHDGRDLYYVEAVEHPSSLWRRSLAGGAAVRVLDGVVLGSFDVVEGGIYYIDRDSGGAGVSGTGRAGGETRLQYFDFATRRSTTVAHELGTVRYGLSASPDGRTIFYSRVDSSVDELMLVENFH